MLNVKRYSFHWENIRRVYENQPAKKKYGVTPAIR